MSYQWVLIFYVQHFLSTMRRLKGGQLPQLPWQLLEWLWDLSHSFPGAPPLIHMASGEQQLMGRWQKSCSGHTGRLQNLSEASECKGAAAAPRRINGTNHKFRSACQPVQVLCTARKARMHGICAVLKLFALRQKLLSMSWEMQRRCRPPDVRLQTPPGRPRLFTHSRTTFTFLHIIKNNKLQSL